ncbi:ABC transporter ATP-binding protein [Streptomyces coeruleorubidus]|jgi:ABC-2 type transport system ATP-binding protein|uniref:ABC transporter ATP-binding protein n=1 Tax=Streptomyces coeruleorubidus TaxID=116188 RepID=UPI0033CFA13D
MTKATIEVSGLVKTYAKKRVVDGLSFTVNPGTVTGFLGPNGAGKSTTLRMLLGLTRPDAGTALIGGRGYHEHPEPLRVVGALMDARWTHPKRSARAHLTWLARSNRIPVQRVDEVLAQVGLTDVAGKRVGGFSLGMAQRLGLAGALLGDPGVLVLDEPANGLDPEGIAWMRGLLRALAAEGRTVFVSSHLLAEMAQLADDVVMIGRGKLITQGSVTDLTSLSSTEEVLVRAEEPERLRDLVVEHGATVVEAPERAEALLVSGMSSEDIGRAAARAGLVLFELAPRRRTVEDAYLKLTADSVEYRGSVQQPMEGSRV